jgi:hypothetical protein
MLLLAAGQYSLGAEPAVVTPASQGRAESACVEEEEGEPSTGRCCFLVSCWRGSALSELREQNRKRAMRGKGATSFVSARRGAKKV